MAQFSDADLRKAFDDVDKDKSGFIEAKEISKLLVDLGLKKDEADKYAAVCMKEDDPNGDGKLSFAEFKAAVCK